MYRRLIALGVLAVCVAGAAERKTENVFVVMVDGLRWQELFHGAERALIAKKQGVSNVAEVEREYWRDSDDARRIALMPFLWGTASKQGQIFGNRKLGSSASVTNGMNFSYPGYSETLCGFADPRINSNDKVPNPNVTVLEWIHSRPGFKGKVAAFGAWDVISAAANGERGGFVANAGYDPLDMPGNERVQMLNRLKMETRYWDGEPFDAFAFHTALEYVKVKKPRLLFLSLGEPDEWAHSGQYEKYLHSIRRVDAYLKELWDAAQSMPEYQGKTSIIFLPDHGRGDAPVKWKSHGEEVPDSKYIWMAFLRPDTQALGERSNVEAVTQNQVAATAAALLGEDYAGSVTKAGKPIVAVLPKP